jgi:hypothetical protein
MTTATEAYRYGRLRIALFNREVPTIPVGRAVYFPLRGLCEQLGIAPQKQIERLRADTRIAPYLRMLPLPTIKDLRDAICVRKQDVSKWLAGLDPARCSIGERTRTDLERFQAELFAAADRFLWGDTGELAYDAATKTAAPVTGVLRVGHCPGCGMALCLTFDGDGAHLAPDEGEE